jgi:hypothetical protein
LSPWLKFIYLGDTSIMLPAAVAIAASLSAAKAWRLVFIWSILFLTGLCVVTLSKMAFAGWGVGIPAIGFKTISGHAMLTSAVVPVLFDLASQSRAEAIRKTALALSVVFCVLIGLLLAVFDFHSIPEIVMGWMVGVVVSAAFLRALATQPRRLANPAVLMCGVVTFFLVWHARPGMLEHWMIALTMHLAGTDSPYNMVTW